MWKDSVVFHFTIVINLLYSGSNKALFSFCLLQKHNLIIEHQQSEIKGGGDVD